MEWHRATIALADVVEWSYNSQACQDGEEVQRPSFVESTRIPHDRRYRSVGFIADSDVHPIGSGADSRLTEYRRKEANRKNGSFDVEHHDPDKCLLCLLQEAREGGVNNLGQARKP